MMGLARTMAVAATLLAAAVPVTAWGQSTDDEQRQACTGDAFSLCLSAIPDRTLVEQCLKAHRAELSAECRAVVDGGRPPGRGRTRG